MRLIAYLFTQFVVLLALQIVAGAPTPKADFDFEKFILPRWWVTHKGESYRQYHKCMLVAVGKFFKNRDYFVELAHTSSGVIDTSYHPITPDPTGYNFTIQGEATGRVDVLETDYNSQAIVRITMVARGKPFDFLAVMSNRPTLTADEEKSISEILKKTTGTQLSDLSKIDNSDCPVDEKTQLAV